ncbi:urease accessory protein UreF [Isoptericola variabilis]|uniref:Putative urease accessory protein n=1 Tax=Isoptericola variabilis (strain 225) TaxID=743718 RepID=F6FR34_ISOV2|nr:urease accessory UreF family protein [Isoptericola variabilis]AEG44984.1 putative urease accessory protein [Isoptericola variabilis 225]TWH26004.1 urease accessory protein [Isoptericola variabilis J7]
MLHLDDDAGPNPGRTAGRVPATGAPSALLLVLLADARLPSGGHTQSGGLEPAVRAGVPPADVPAYLRARLRTVTAVEAGTAVVARAAAAAGEDLGTVDAAWAARTPSPALRANARRLGRGYLRVARTLWPVSASPAEAARHDPLDDVRARAWARPVVLGALAHRAGLGACDLARLVGYDDVQTVVSALLKLEPADPLETTAIVRDLLPEVEALATHVAPLRRPEDIPAGGAPLVERWAESHATTTERLFSA